MAKTDELERSGPLIYHSASRSCGIAAGQPCGNAEPRASLDDPLRAIQNALEARSGNVHTLRWCALAAVGAFVTRLYLLPAITRSGNR